MWWFKLEHIKEAEYDFIWDIAWNWQFFKHLSIATQEMKCKEIVGFMWRWQKQPPKGALSKQVFF